MSDLSDEQLRNLYAWIDAIPLSRPKRNIARDFSDGLMLAEVIAAYFPNLVELHNYSPASAVQQKIYNFETLNQRVLKKFGFQITRPVIEDIVNGRPGAIEGVLNTLQARMAKYKEKISSQDTSIRDEEEKQTPSLNALNPIFKDNLNQISGEKAVKQAAIASKNPTKKNPTESKLNMLAAVNEELLVEKDQTISELRETIEILEIKISKLEQLVKLKDIKIQKLQQQK